jgi:rod shape determining protein RodA
MNDQTSRWQKLLGRVDWVLVGLTTAIAVIGMVNLASASQASEFAYHLTQGGWYLVGLGVVAVMSLFDYRLFERWAYVMYGMVVLLLAAVLVVGTELNGSQRWLNFGFFLMQPSELLKVVLVIMTARYFQDDSQAEPRTLRDLAVPLTLVGVAAGLIIQQPDLGTALLILLIFMTMVLFEGIDRSSLVIVGLAGMVAVPVGWNFGMHDYQKERVLAFLELESDQYGASWQVRQSVIAFGSGRVWGKGHGEGTQVKKGFVPEHENDFIAANWGEEHGFVGMLLVLGLYVALMLRALGISRRARDTFGAHIGVGVAAILFWHVLLNLGMVTGMVPVVGLTLPLLSYGGSSLLTTMVGIGLLLNVAMRRKPVT